MGYPYNFYGGYKAKKLDIDELYVDGSKLVATPAQLNGLAQSFTSIAVLDGSPGKKAIPINGVTLITGGSGINDMTIAAPAVGSFVIIKIDTLTDGNVKVTTDEGVTFDGTNNTATFDAANEALVLVYKSETQWAVALNIGGVTFSSVTG